MTGGEEKNICCEKCEIEETSIKYDKELVSQVNIKDDGWR